MISRTGPADNRSRRFAEGMLLATTIIWGATFATTKTLLVDGMSPIWLVAWRFGIAAVVFLILFSPRIVRTLSSRTLLVGILLGLLLYAGFGLQTAGLQSTSSSRSGFITALYVVITPFIQMFAGRGRPTMRVWGSVFIVTTGLWLLTGSVAEGIGFFSGLGIGEALTLGCAASFAFYIVVLDQYGRGIDPIPLTAVQLVVVLAGSTLHAGLTEEWSMPSSIGGWGLMFFLAIAATVFTTWCQTRYQPVTTPARASIIYTMESVFAALIALIFLQEVLGAAAYVGGLLIVAGLFLVETGDGATTSD